MVKEDKDVTPRHYDEYWTATGILVDERIEEIRNLCPVVESVVDLGGGSGGLAKELNALVVDWSPVACRIADAQGVKAICDNILSFLKTDRKFDLVILADVLEEMKESETKELLDGIRKICNKYFVISTPVHENYLDISTHQVIYSKEELVKMITDLGFTQDSANKHPDRLIVRFTL
jgi:hypothetical protein